jgi:hypothetical protein
MKILVTACTLLALTIPTFMTPRQAVADELKENGCQSIVGTYLATATSISDATSVSRELITFNKDGNFTASFRTWEKSAYLYKLSVFSF